MVPRIRMLASSKAGAVAALLVLAGVPSCSPVLLTPGPAPLPPGLPKRYRVHIDHVARARTADFESARRQLLAALAEKHVTEGTTFVLETDEPAYLSLRPFDRYADLDAAGARQKAIDDAVGESTLARLDTLTHSTLVPPHKNEIWSLQTSLTYAPDPGPTLATAAAGRLVEDEVMPDKDDAYGEAVTLATHALAEAHFPVSRFVFSSAYGSGRYVTLWLAVRAADLDLELPREALLGEAQARAAAEHEDRRGVVVRGDLASR